MNRDDTARLVNLIIATWPAGPKGIVWTQALEPLERAPANRAYQLLRDTAPRMTVADFMVTYRNQTGQPATTGTRRGTPNPDCPHCDGCGYEPGPPITTTTDGRPHIANGQPTTYTTQQPCRCTR